MNIKKFCVFLVLASTFALGSVIAQESDDSSATERQRPDREQQRPRRENMTDEQRAAARERWQGMSDEDRQAARDKRGSRGNGNGGKGGKGGKGGNGGKGGGNGQRDGERPPRTATDAA